MRKNLSKQRLRDANKYSFRFHGVIRNVFINRNFGAEVSYRCVGNL